MRLSPRATCLSAVAVLLGLAVGATACPAASDSASTLSSEGSAPGAATAGALLESPSLSSEHPCDARVRMSIIDKATGVFQVDSVSLVAPSGICVASKKVRGHADEFGPLWIVHGLQPRQRRGGPTGCRPIKLGDRRSFRSVVGGRPRVRNVSNGHINRPLDDAQWFYDTFSRGHIVTVIGMSTQLAPARGYGDWNIPWDGWLQGSVLN